jgi:hypothetical protein
VLGLFTRVASFAGMVLLLFYYVAHPPLVGLGFGSAQEGHYLVVNKNLVELAALAVFAFTPGAALFGLDRLIKRVKGSKEIVQDKKPAEKSVGLPKGHRLDRRELIKNLATLPILGAFIYAVYKKRGWESYEEKNLTDRTKVDGITSATVKTFNFAGLEDLKGELPFGKIGNLELSRVFLGGNLIGGWAHARDLIYASKLVKAYHTKEKIFSTFLLAEKCGVNAILTSTALGDVINEYWRRKIGNIQFITTSGGKMDLETGFQYSIDMGASAVYLHGGIADKMVRDGKVEEIGNMVEQIRQKGVPAGIGAHDLETVKACVKHGLKPDFWMKTIHQDNYWSAHSAENRKKFDVVSGKSSDHNRQHDNMWSLDPEETISFMNGLKEPWIAFKVMAAGAIRPEEGFRYAFENGADFVCAGMYDFQIVEDINIAYDILNSDLNRIRPWMA